MLNSRHPLMHPVSDHGSQAIIPGLEWSEQEVLKWDDLARQYGDMILYLRELMAQPGGRWRGRYGKHDW